MGFKCHRCGKIFCSDHRLPEAHDCEYQNIIYERQNPGGRDVPALEERIYKSIFSRADNWRR
jgi:predicted nucleic acid binding AN1-type Zn finger protein